MRLYFFFILLSASSYSQNIIEWQKCYGGSNSDKGKAIEKSFDGGFIMCGQTKSNDGDLTLNHGNWDAWVCKLDQVGNILWEKSFGGSSIDWFHSVIQTSDNGYLLCGASESMDGDLSINQGGLDLWVVKLDNNGTIIWQKTLGGSNIDAGYSAIETSNGEFIICGNSKSSNGDLTFNAGNYDVWVVMISSNGNLLWQKSYGGSQNDQCYSIDINASNQCYLAGFTDSSDGDVSQNNGSTDAWVIKLDLNGNILWEKSFGGSLNESAFGIKSTSDLGCIITGNTRSSDGDIAAQNIGETDLWIVKISELGDMEWEKSFGGSLWEMGRDILIDNNNYLVCGYTRSWDYDINQHNGNKDFWILKVDDNGNLTSENCYGGNQNDEAYSIIKTLDGGILLMGESDSNGNDVSGNHGLEDFWIVKLGSESAISETELLSTKYAPNPTQDEITITIGAELVGTGFTISDNAGRIVLEETFKAIEHKVDLSAFENGVYFIRTDKESQPVKIIKQ